MQNQINSNGTEKCLIKLGNTGSENITMETANLSLYYTEDTLIEDIIPKANSTEVQEVSQNLDKLFNLTIKLFNNLSSSKTVNLTTNITNSTGYVLNSSTILNVNIVIHK